MEADTEKSVDIDGSVSCRLCDENQDVMHSVFDIHEDGKEIVQLIKENIPIILYKNDPLSKYICQSCLDNLSNLSSFKKICTETQERHKDKLKSQNNIDNTQIQEFLTFISDIPDEADELKDASTMTDDLTVECVNCRQGALDPNTITNGESNENNNGDVQHKNEVETDKVLRKRKIQPLYNEIEDSLCSSLTEFTQNTEGEENNSNCAFDDRSDSESIESNCELSKKPKRRKIAETKENGLENVETVPEISYEDLFLQEPDYRYQPLSLLQLTLNCINMQNIPDYEPLNYIEESTECFCKCGLKFKNWKMLAVHEKNHIEVEVGQKVDEHKYWEQTNLDTESKNKWTNNTNENSEPDDGDIILNDEEMISDEPQSNLLVINKETETKNDGKADEIILVGTKAMVNGIALADYSKEERKSFYQSLRIGGLTKKFCTLCRYCFKDNWAIESHYFSSACFYTCRYCGMRFNKQRHKYDEHIKEHEDKKDAVSDKIYAASKVHNFLPKIIPSQRIKTQEQIKEEEEMKLKAQEEARELAKARAKEMAQYQFNFHRAVKVKNLERNSLPPDLSKIKLENADEMNDRKDMIFSNSKGGNQAYFCRKCYKVFFKIDEYNTHSKICGEPQNIAPKPNLNVNRQNPNLKIVSPPNMMRNGEISRPQRQCVRQAIKDDIYIPETLLRETVTTGNPQAFVCHICNTPFPTIYSRNSHMRIHKGELPMLGQKISNNRGQILTNIQNVNNYQKMSIKQEPMDISMEPMVEIHEDDTQTNIPNSLCGGAVSLTPISKNPNIKPTINPNIIKLVQNNPNITISKSSNSNNNLTNHSTNVNNMVAHHNNSFNDNQTSSNILNMINAQARNHNNTINNLPGTSSFIISPQEDKTYKCSSCWEAFANKSHLYFHKKNQCEGSRFPCPFCKKRFGTEAAYSSHIFYSHPE